MSTMLPSVFNAPDHEPMGDFKAIPAADYLAQITKTEMKKCKATAKDPNGQYLMLTFDLLDAKFKGRKLFENLNLVNSSVQAVEIANGKLRSICDALGIGQVSDAQVLQGKPMMITVGIKPANPPYPEGNKITAFKRADGSTASAPGSTPSSNPFEDDDNTIGDGNSDFEEPEVG